MHVSVAVLADHANVAKGEKLNILGVFDSVFAERFPVVHPFMVLALRLGLSYEDGGRSHKLTVVLVDEDGKAYMRAGGDLQVPPIEPGNVAHINQILNFAGMGFVKPGHFKFIIQWDDEEAGHVDLFVRKGSPPAARR